MRFYFTCQDILTEFFRSLLKRAEEPRLLNTREAAQYLRRSERWVRQEVALGKLPCVREGNSRPRFDRESLDRWIARHNGRV
jgi:excisionase family DNA binding protein